MFATNAFLISAPSTSLALIAFNRHMKETQFNWARSKEWKRNHRQAAGTGGEGGQVEEEDGGSKDKQSEITEAFQLSGFEPGRKIFSLLRWWNAR